MSTESMPPTGDAVSPPPMFDHERLTVYHSAINFVAIAQTIIDALPRGTNRLADQLHRASTSIPLNIAEGAGEYRRREKARFYRIARRSATESAAILDVLAVLRLSEQARLSPARDLLGQVVAMLTTMTRKLGAARPSGGNKLREREREREGERGASSGGAAGS